jgi:general secretion pathway protein D
MLAGLIKEENKGTLTGIEGLSRIPLLGRLFTNDDVEVTKLDTIITITGYIIRSPEISEEDLRAVTIGTESNIGISLSDMLNNKPKGEESILVDNKKIDELMQDEKPSAAPATVIPPQTGVPAGQIPEQRKETPPEEQPENSKTAAPPVIENEQVTLEPPPESLPEDLTEVTIQPPAVATTTGQAFSIQVVIDNGKDVGHTPFYLIFDPNYLEVLDVSQGGYLAQDGRQVSFLHSENNATGEIRVGLSRLGATEGVNGGGVLAVITFKAKERGKSYLTFTNCSVKNPRAENLPVEFLPAEINVE